MNEQLKKDILHRNETNKHGKGKWSNPSDPVVIGIMNATSFLPKEAIMAERVHCVLNDIDHIVICQNEKCNKPSGFNKKTYKYRKYCCSTCSNSSTAKQALTKKTCLEKYGVENVMQNDGIKKISSQNNPTHAEGYDNTKFKQTMLEKYGVDHPMKSEAIKNNLKNTMLEKYGVENIMHSEAMQNKFSSENIQKSLVKFKKELADNNYELLASDDEFKGKSLDILYKFKCKTCNNVFENRISANRTLPICPICNNVKESGVSGMEKDICSFIEEHYRWEILRNKKNLMKERLEIDIFLPKLNIGFEVNGLYFHSLERGKDENYHIGKRDMALDANIELVQIFEDEWNSDKDHIQNLILSKINRIDAEYAIIMDKEMIEVYDNGTSKVMECKLSNYYLHDFKFLKPVNLKKVFEALKDGIETFYIEDDLRFNCFSFLEGQYSADVIPPYMWTADLHKREERFTSLNNPFEENKHLSIYDCGYKVYSIK